MRKIILLFLFSLIINNGFAQRRLYKKHHLVNKVLSEIKKDKNFKNASFAFFAVDSKTGQVVSSYHPDMALRPASNQKLITTATALELYGIDYCFTTKLKYTGKIDTANHILHGNLIIKGGGDPTLGSKYFDDTKEKQFIVQWINAVKMLNIVSIDGTVIADAQLFSNDIVPLSRSWNNMGNYYGAGACGLSIFDDYYTLFFNTDSLPGGKTKITSVEPDMPFMIFDNGIYADTVKSDHSNIMGAPYCNTRYLRGSLPVGKTGFKVKGSMPDPAYFTAFYLNNTLENSGIKVKGNPTTIRLLQLNEKNISDKQTVICTTYSPPLSEIIKQTNIHSINLFSEHLLAICGLNLVDTAQTELNAKAVTDFWAEKGMDTQGMTLTDGSGLSQYNLITPRQMVFVLNYMKNQSQSFDTYYNSLPVAGRQGTVKNMLKGTAAEGNLRAKSGTIDKGIAYSGYVTSKSGREIIFSMIVNNFSCKSKKAKAELEKLMIALAEMRK